MELPGVRRLFAFNEWANGRMLSSVSSLSPEDLRRELGGSFGSLWGTLVHIIGVEWLYAQRWRGRSPRALPKLDGFVERRVNPPQGYDARLGEYVLRRKRRGIPRR